MDMKSEKVNFANTVAILALKNIRDYYTKDATSIKELHIVFDSKPILVADNLRSNGCSLKQCEDHGLQNHYNGFANPKSYCTYVVVCPLEKWLQDLTLKTKDDGTYILFKPMHLEDASQSCKKYVQIQSLMKMAIDTSSSIAFYGSEKNSWDKPIFKYISSK